jgi:MFS family permease
MTFSRSTHRVAIVLAGQAIANMDNAIVNVATPSIGATLHAGGGALQLTVVAYVIASATLLVPAARLGSVVGLRALFAGGVALFTLASLACGFAPNVATLVASRAVQGAGAACMVAQVIAAIHRYAEPAVRPRAIAAYTMTLSLSGVAGQILGGAIVSLDAFGLAWRPIFLVNVPIGVALVALALRAMPRERTAARDAADVDAAGVALLAATILAFVVPLTLGREWGWPVWSIAVLVASAPALVAFVAWERRQAARGAKPLLALALFADEARAWDLVALLLARLTYFSLLFVLALYLQDGLHASALVSGASLAIWALATGRRDRSCRDFREISRRGRRPAERSRCPSPTAPWRSRALRAGTTSSSSRRCSPSADSASAASRPRRCNG